ncbi:tRNA 2-selenouridine synthase [Catalinimonas alkaloidigena]|uniref:tRNA 2-selenouridine synthase n=1 Tax=Catalinimonas alkaloidigena TaxID=1075417 RepID=A0A1G9D7C5_9BACT|nr:tRNA 2-selenouridine(34) synthase MnmH [Catalinimonas alkaloidigena]SDK59789.1 tRNA 2-selenouridine synthase [Catalinimonas alkaloidigena]
MAALPISDFLTRAGTLPVLDVRTPAEFAQGHIPGACNLPLFSNEERAQVGTTYKQIGREEAFLQGLDLVGPKMRALVEAGQQLAPQRRVLMHCWRGGMRSGSVAWLLQTAGFQVDTLVGGYKAYRHEVLEAFARPARLLVLAGETGSGKTAILRALAERGEQVIDLEHLAHHRGSAFGGIGLPAQPTTEQFQNALHATWATFDRARRVWLEDESFSIGQVQLPHPLWQQMKAAHVVQVQVPRHARVQRLVAEYGSLERDALAHAILTIQKRLGGQHVAATLDALRAGRLDEVAERLLVYYDKSYQIGLQRRQAQATTPVACTTGDPVRNAQQILQTLDA